MRINEPKMTNELAREYILANYFDADEDTKAFVDGDEEHWVMKCAVEALEKQIPKETEIKDDGTAEIFAYNKKGVPILKFPTRTAKILCPRCRCENPTHPYCSECGQKIDGILL